MDEATDSMVIHYGERDQIIQVQMKENSGVSLKTNECGKWFVSVSFLFKLVFLNANFVHFFKQY
jgi:hypothetical protein